MYAAGWTELPLACGARCTCVPSVPFPPPGCKPRLLGCSSFNVHAAVFDNVLRSQACRVLVAYAGAAGAGGTLGWA